MTRWRLVGLAAATLALGSTAVAMSEILPIGARPDLQIAARIKPSVLPRHRRVPVGLTLSGTMVRKRLSSPKEIAFTFDRGGAFGQSKFKPCERILLEIVPAKLVRTICPGALVGSGSATLVPAKGPAETRTRVKLTVFNAPSPRRMGNLLIHTVLPGGGDATIVPVHLERLSDRRFGTLAGATVPNLEKEGWRLRSFRLTLIRRPGAGHRPRSLAVARCARGQLLATAVVTFYDRSPTEITPLSQPCRTAGDR